MKGLLLVAGALALTNASPIADNPPPEASKPKGKLEGDKDPELLAAQTPTLDAWSTEIYLGNEKINYGNMRPADMIRNLAIGPKPICKPAPACIGETPAGQGFTVQMVGKHNKIENQEILPVIESSYHGDQLGAFIDVLAKVMDNVTETNSEKGRERGKKEDQNEYTAPSMISLTRRSADSAVGGKFNLRFKQANDGTIYNYECPSLPLLKLTSIQLTDLLYPKNTPEVSTAAQLQTISLCCDENPNDCLKKSASALKSQILDFFPGELF